MQELITKILLEIQNNLSASNMDYLDVLNRMLSTLLAYNKE